MFTFWRTQTLCNSGLTVVNRHYTTGKNGTVLLGGGTGFVGKQLKKMLIQNDYKVKVISRKGQDMTWDDLKKDGLPDNTVAVVNLAGEPIMNAWKRWNDKFKKSLWDSRVETNRLIARAIEDAQVKPKAFVAFSGVGIYPPSNEAVYDEDYKVKDDDDSFFQKMVIALENATKTSTEIRTVLIRSGIVLGAKGGVVQALYQMFCFYFGNVISGGDQYFPWIHINDVCRLTIFAIEHKQVDGVLNGVAPQTITNREFSESLAKAVHRPLWFKTPAAMYKLMYGEERAAMLYTGQIVKPKKVLASGFKYEYDTIDKALNQTVQEIQHPDRI
ncbi:epimerase family protein SDR39U1-like isoform X2 [Adelges cooleyi]|uniref:epimerase family protein SDR39U1-like isoform X2 n=1 Tax=Adelges cooleyi TaxID=133065 RepID=UPI00217FC4AF|nr:epimerase family protein SDR39U1-like isoform X2 [Adelges cooleyi]